MRVKTAAAYLVAPRLRHHSASVARKQWTYNHNGAAQSGSLLGKFRALQHVKIHLIRLKLVAATLCEQGTVVVQPAHLHAQKLQQTDKLVDIADVGDILYRHPVTRKQHSAYHLQCLVLGTLRMNGSMELMPTYYFKR